MGLLVMNKKRILAALCALGCTFTLTACGNKAEKILGYVDKMDFDGALDYYDEKVDGSSKEREIRKEVKSEMEDKYEAILDKYNEGELDDDALEDLYEFVEELKLDNDDYEDFSDKLVELKTSKQNYEWALNSLEEEDYQMAIYYLQQVVKSDKNYKEAQAKLEETENAQVEEKLSGVEEYLADQDYEEAINLLNSYKYDFEDNEKFKELYEKVNKEVVDYSKAEINKYFEEDDYSEASNFIRNLALYYFSDNEEMNELYNNIDDNYAAFVIAKADKEFAAKNYADAAVLIQDAINAIGDDNDKLNAANEKYSKYLPVYLNDMDYSDLSGTRYINYFGSTSDYFGNKYKNSYYIYGLLKKPGYAVYDIKGEYNTFKGVASIIESYSEIDGVKAFEIYGDDKLLYTSPAMTTDSTAENFEIDITGVQKIKINYPVADNANAFTGLFDACFVKTGDTPAQAPTEATTETATDETTETAEATEAATEAE